MRGKVKYNKITTASNRVKKKPTIQLQNKIILLYRYITKRYEIINGYSEQKKVKRSLDKKRFQFTNMNFYNNVNLIKKIYIQVDKNKNIKKYIIIL